MRPFPVACHVSIEMRPPRVGERGWWLADGMTAEQALADVLAEVEDDAIGWLCDDAAIAAGAMGPVACTVVVTYERPTAEAIIRHQVGTGAA